MTSQEGGGGGKSKGGGQDISKLQDLFINHQRGVQLNLLTADALAKTRAEELTVNECMKSFEFLFKTHMAGAGSVDEEQQAKAAVQSASRRYHKTLEERKKHDDIRVLPTLFVVLVSNPERLEEDVVERYARPSRGPHFMGAMRAHLSR
jgi:hypothetical protein